MVPSPRHGDEPFISSRVKSGPVEQVDCLARRNMDRQKKVQVYVSDGFNSLEDAFLEHVEALSGGRGYAELKRSMKK